jgi:hypothetical protein
MGSAISLIGGSIRVRPYAERVFAVGTLPDDIKVWYDPDTGKPTEKPHLIPASYLLEVQLPVGLDLDPVTVRLPDGDFTGEALPGTLFHITNPKSTPKPKSK